MMFSYDKKEDIHYITFNYDLNIISYEQYQQMILECVDWYNLKIKEIKDKYELLMNPNNFKYSVDIAKEQKNILIELIKKVLVYYPITKNMSFGIYISNSFARTSNLIDSDFDINFVYENDDYEIGFQIEEQICYALTQIVGKYRDFVHDSIASRRAVIPNYIDFNDNDKLIFKTVWNNKTEEYEITKGNERLMIRHCYGSRNLGSMTNYYLSYINDASVNEWIYYQEVICGHTYLQKLFDTIKQKEQELMTKEIYNNLIKKMITEISFDYHNVDFMDMKNIKHYFKNIPYNKIFSVLALIKKKLLFYDIDLLFNDTYTLLNSKCVKEYLLIDDLDFIYEYLGIIMRLNLICNKSNIGFRTRYSNKSIKSFIECYNDCLDIDNDYIKYHEDMINSLYKNLLSILDKLEWSSLDGHI